MLCAVIVFIPADKVVNALVPIVDANKFVVVNSPVNSICLANIAIQERAAKNELSKELIYGIWPRPVTVLIRLLFSSVFN